MAPSIDIAASRLSLSSSAAPTSSANGSEFQDLLTLLNSSLTTYRNELALASLPEPHFFAAKPHPLDDPLYFPSINLFNARRQLVGALDMLKNLVQDPSVKIMAESAGHYMPAALDFVMQAKVADSLVAAGSQGLTAQQLVQASGLNISAAKLTKIMRYLSNHLVFAETAQGTFVNTRVSIRLVSDSPTRSYAAFQAAIGLPTAASLAKTLLEPATALSDDPLDCALSRAFDFQGLGVSNAWEFLAKHQPKALEDFGHTMSSASRAQCAGLLADFPWKTEFASGTTIVDIGGGQGGFMLPLLKTFPHLRGVLQDRPETIDQARLHFAQGLPEVLDTERLSLQPHDFNTEQPLVGEQYHYVLKAVLHDYPDHLSVGILKALAPALLPTSRVLILDILLASPSSRRVEDNAAASSDAQAELAASPPFPLPITYGGAGNLAHAIDMEMMSALNGTERTLDDFKRIFKQAGLEYVKTWPLRSSMSIIEARKA
ncbi:hypothetical protein OC846_004983 [Tilletia horrida]|uniref:O-methyltransferase domain-containing protein n=1 Tax=Tilletia horrida TaxID=155126 RepID=A0AAN6GMP2_9BASI|nr:hypothetical protein OC846_004983 [Tilletia horrida]KAK0554915.1 hypothetical protein OC845_000556 [Tilletia horrida]KAK0562697.1 hypothetical protein OC861_005186 [Tilletia horrida]